MKKGEALRSCIACRRIAEKKTLLRLVLSPGNEVIPDFYAKLAGRGAYVCFNAPCMKKVFDGRLLRKSFKGNVEIPTLEDVVGILTLMGNEKTASLLSMGIRSRKAILGTEAVEVELKKEKLSLLLLSCTLSEVARNRWKGKMMAKGIHVKVLPHAKNIEKVLGGRKVVALRDEALAIAVMGEIEKMEKLGAGLIQ